MSELHPSSGGTSVECFSPRHITWWILAVGALLRIVFFLLSDNNGTDALARTSLTAGWLAQPSLKLAFGDWLPLHFWLMGGLAVIMGNVELAARLLSLLTGVASLWLVWKIAHEVYAEAAANLSLLVFSLYSLHIGYSTTSSSEAPYLFFVLAGFLCFLIYQRSGRLRWVALSGMGLTLAAAIRYEAWAVMFGVALVLLGPAWRTAPRSFWRSAHLSLLVLFGVTAGSWPAFWMSYCWLKWKHPFYFVAMNHVNVARTLTANPSSDLYRLSVLPGALLLTLSPLALAASLYALWLTIWRSTGRQIAVVVLTVAFVQFYQVVSGGVMAFARYTITLGTLLAIMSGYGLESIAHRYLPQAVRTFRIVIIAVLVLNLGTILGLSEARWRFSEKFGSISPRVRFDHYIQDLGANLRPRLDPKDYLVIDDYNVESNIVAAAAGLPLTGDRAFLASSEKPLSLRSDLRTFMETRHPKYLVYSDRGVLRLYLALPGGCPSTQLSSEGMEFRCLFANEVYTLYEISYPSLKKPLQTLDSSSGGTAGRVVADPLTFSEKTTPAEM